MAVRLTHHRRVAIAALFLCFVVATMLMTFGVDKPGQRESADRTAGGNVTPVGAGITHSVASEADWDLAVAAVQPGDVIRLTATINSRLVYRGDNDGGTATGAHGTAAAPIVITANPGVWIDPGNTSSGVGALDILFVDHVHAVAVNVRNAQFGIRCLQCNGSAGYPIRLADNTVTDIGHAGINFAGHWSSHAPSSHGLIENNVISNTGSLQSQFGEGIYLGYGSVEWVDVTSDVEVKGNDISFTGAEGIDVKPGTRNIVVTGNYIHDLAPIDGGAISAHYVNASPNPHPSQLDPVLIEGNRIWNLNQSGVAGSNDWAIWVGHGGVEVVDNVIWGLRDDVGATRSVRVRATQDFGPHAIRIEGNTFWSSRGWVAEGSPSGAGNVMAVANIGVEPTSSEIAADTLAFVGPLPLLGASGSADNGSGPGSAFALVGAGSTTTTAPTTTTTAPTTTTTAPTTTTTAPTTTAAPTTTTTTASTTTSTPPTTATPTSSTTADPTISPSTTTTTADPATPPQSAPTTTTVPTTAESVYPTISLDGGSEPGTIAAPDGTKSPPGGAGAQPAATAATFPEPGLDPGLSVSGWSGSSDSGSIGLKPGVGGGGSSESASGSSGEQLVTDPRAQPEALAFDADRASSDGATRQPDPVAALREALGSPAGEDRSEYLGATAATNQAGAVGPGPGLEAGSSTVVGQDGNDGDGWRTGAFLAGVGAMAALSLGWLRSAKGAPTRR